MEYLSTDPEVFQRLENFRKQQSDTAKWANTDFDLIPIVRLFEMLPGVVMVDSTAYHPMTAHKWVGRSNRESMYVAFAVLPEGMKAICEVYNCLQRRVLSAHLSKPSNDAPRHITLTFTPRRKPQSDHRWFHSVSLGLLLQKGTPEIRAEYYKLIIDTLEEYLKDPVAFRTT